MNDDIITAGDDLLKKVVGIDKFARKYNIFPVIEADRIVSEMKELSSSIPAIQTPENQEQLIQSEMKRRLNGETIFLKNRITPMLYDFDSVVSIYNIPKPDIDGLKGWLVANKDKTSEAIDRLYLTKDIQNYELGLQVDIPSVNRQAEEFAAVHIQKYHKRLGKLLQKLTNVGEFLRDINAAPTTKDRSYFNSLTNTMAIGIPAICFTTEDGSMHIREKELISLYGHEGMGHALNQVITKNSELPYFLKTDTVMTASTAESIAQFYQNVIFEDLKKSPETQKDLGIEHKFGEIYQEAKDVAQLQEYQQKLYQYSITVLADKSLGHPGDNATMKKKIDAISEVALDPSYPLHMVESNRYSFDSQGNLTHKLVGELRYCARPVQRALEEFAKQGIEYEGAGRSKIDATLLKGFWTPTGYVDNARLSAKSYTV